MTVALGACSEGESERASEPQTTTSAPPTTARRDGPTAYVESGDYTNGRHVATVSAFDQVAITFDVVQFLTGDAAVAAYQEDHDGSDTPDNDYYVRNQSMQLRTLPVAEAVEIRVNNAGGYPPSEPPDGHEVNPSTFASYVKAGSAGGLFWLTIEGGTVTAIEEQYVP